MLGFFIYTMSEVVKGMSSIQRVKEYIDFNDFEADFAIPEPVKAWPATGEIEIKDVSVRYREKLPLVLNKLSFNINNKENVGIIGRTGSGKSTFLLTLTRILELAENENSTTKGSIKIDGQDISKIGLHHLRNHITAIPQDPWLVEGSLRFSIDPFEKYSDEEIIRVIKLVGLDETISGDILQHEIATSGSNLSLG